MLAFVLLAACEEPWPIRSPGDADVRGEDAAAPVDAGAFLDAGPLDGGARDAWQPPYEGPELDEMLDDGAWLDLFPEVAPLYTREALLEAAVATPNVVGVGDETTRRRELAAFLAHCAHETTGGWAEAPGGPYAWGFHFTEELGCEDGGCASYCAPSVRFPCAEGQSYHARGPMQIRGNEEYGEAGEALGLDLLADPGLVVRDSVVAFRTALWVWTRTRSPYPSPHDVMVGEWTPGPGDAEAGRVSGFGMTTLTLERAAECGRVDPRALDREGFYRTFCEALGVDPGPAIGCVTMEPY